jgi:tRNA (guanine37-N1)-methyltransferase
MKLKDLLRDTLSSAELSLLVQGYDLVGDIAITIIPPALSHRQDLIGAAIMASNKRIKVVAKRDGVHQGEYRTLPLTVIAGEQRNETLHCEFGIRLLLNPESVYFSVRSGTERKRVADMVQPHENVLVMFSGVAPYPLMINRFSKADSIIGIESNRLAHDYGLQNIRINKAQKGVSLFCGDVAEVVPRLDDRFHRIVMPLPTGALDFVSLALESLLPRGTLHIYDFQPLNEYGAALDSIHKLCRTAGREMELADYVVCGHTSPGIRRICLDIAVK